MTISVGNQGAGAAGTTSVVLTYPTVAATAIAVLLVGGKPYSSTPTVDNTDWIDLANDTSGAVANGSGTGSVRARAWYQIGNVNGGASDTVSLTSGSPVHGRIWEFTKTLANWDQPVAATLTDVTETGTGVSATIAASTETVPDVGLNDMIVMCVVIKDDGVTHTSQTLTIPGCTVGTITWVAGTTATGNQMAQYIGTCTISAGAATGFPVYAATSSVSGASSTAVSFIRLREYNITSPPEPIASSRVVQQAAMQRSSLW